MSNDTIESVVAYRDLVRDLLAKAAEIKRSNDVEPPLMEADFGDFISRIRESDAETNKPQKYAAVETAFREKFYELLVIIEYPSCRISW